MSNIYKEVDFKIDGLTNNQYIAILNILFIFTVSDGDIDKVELDIINEFSKINGLYDLGINVNDHVSQYLTYLKGFKQKDYFDIIEENIEVLKDCNNDHLIKLFDISFQLTASDGEVTDFENLLLDFAKNCYVAKSVLMSNPGFQINDKISKQEYILILRLFSSVLTMDGSFSEIEDVRVSQFIIINKFDGYKLDHDLFIREYNEVIKNDHHGIDVVKNLLTKLLGLESNVKLNIVTWMYYLADESSKLDVKNLISTIEEIWGTDL